MFLKSLLIKNGVTKEVIRNILFRKGINFIVDETPSENDKKTGNNVGKTTVLRLVDYCLGSTGDNIYKDTEFTKNENTALKNFLKENKISLKLTLSKDLISDDIVIERNFCGGKDRVLAINSNTIKFQYFSQKLKEIIFKNTDKKPTFRQIIAKNIRDDKNKMTNIVKVLHNTTKNIEYESLYLSWFGIETHNAEKKQELETDKKSENEFKNKIEKSGESLPMIEQKLTVIIRNIEKLEAQKQQFNNNPNYKKDIQILNNLKSKMNQVSNQISKLKMREILIIESKNELEKEKTNIDISVVESLYKEANQFITDLNISFEKTINFHNSLIENKLKYITKELPDLKIQIQKLEKDLDILIQKEVRLTKELKNKGLLEDLEVIIKELNENHEQKGGLEARKKQLEECTKKLDDIKKQLQKINQEINEKDESLQKNITSFNSYFAEISKKLYGESYILAATNNQETKSYELRVSNMGVNQGTGKKKGQIAAFDFAYIKFADEKNIPCLHFVMHDQLEVIHGNQLSTLVDIANNMNGQYVVPILKDKIPNYIDIDKSVILSLSQDEKLFKF